MTTAQTICNDALQIAGAVGRFVTPDSVETGAALDILNDMMHGWLSKGVDVGHATLDLSEHVNVLQEHEEGLKLLLATHPRMERVSGKPASPANLAAAKMAWNAIYAAYAAPGPAKLPDGLKRMPNSKPPYDKHT